MMRGRGESLSSSFSFSLGDEEMCGLNFFTHGLNPWESGSNDKRGSLKLLHPRGKPVGVGKQEDDSIYI
jgi:hypothetical protein